MTERQPSPREAELAALIAYHDRRYWELGEPEISDADYDALTRELAALNPAHPLLTRVNAAAAAGGGKVRHAEPMLSLDKAYSLTEVLAWAAKYVRTSAEMLLVEPKYDGISAGYDGEILATRGDGEVGEDITDKMPLIELEAPGYRGPLNRPARGEIIIRNDDFLTLYSRIRKKDGKTYKNARNAVAGIMGLKDCREMLAQGAKLTLADYSLISLRVPASELAARWESLTAELEELPYPMDGIVVKLADTEYRSSLGNTVHHPRGAVAFKFTNRQAESKLLGVEWSFGKNCLTPVALLAPVDISGITIKRATLHNVQFVENLGLMIGDTVTVERAGDVIPHIVSAVPGEKRESPLISACPACGTELVRRGPELCCPAPQCPGAGLQQLASAVRNLGIERLGVPTLKKLTDKFGVRHLRDLFALSKEDFLTLEGFKDKSAENLYTEISRAKIADDCQLLAALNIPGVGLNIAKLILAKHDFAELRTLDETALAEIPGIGPERARAVVSALRDRAGELDELLTAVTIRRGSAAGDAPTICFTGKMPEKRSYYEALATERGYRSVDSVTATLTLLVAMDVNEQSGKLKNARKNGIRIQSLAEFLADGAPAAVRERAPEPAVPRPAPIVPPDDLFAPGMSPEPGLFEEPETPPASPAPPADDFGDLPLFGGADDSGRR